MLKSLGLDGKYNIIALVTIRAVLVYNVSKFDALFSAMDDSLAGFAMKLMDEHIKKETKAAWEKIRSS